jgi:biotin transport system substrate-specific component
MDKNRQTVRDMTWIALFTALLAVSGQFQIPVGPVPITLQPLVVMLAGSLLGAKRGAISMAVFIGLAAAGAPVMAGGTGGLAKLVGPTGGYVFSWLLAVCVIGWLVQKMARHGQIALWQLILAHLIGGVAVVHAIGFAWVVTYLNLPLTMGTLSASLLIFLPGDIAKAVVGAIAAQAMYRAVPALRPVSKG